MDKIVITGCGVKAPGVSNIDQFKDVLELGICTQEILHGRGHNDSNIVCGVVHEDLNMISGENYKRYARAVQLGIAAAEEAYKMANLPNDDFARVAVIMGTSGGGILEVEKFSNHGNNLKKVPIQYVPIGDLHTLSSGITKHLGINRQAYTLSTGCTASLDAIIIMGNLFLEAGNADICIVGGSDAILGDWITYGFLKTGAITENTEIEETGVPFSTACLQNKIWQDMGYTPITVSVNISMRQFFDGEFVETVKNILKETNLDAQYLDLEITESISMDNITSVISTLNELKAMGISISIDDFGTGYSSLSYLKKFPINNLKIDQSFVRDITTNSENRSIVKTIISMANNLNLDVIAEGVETEEELKFLKLNGCRVVQGYVFSPPISGEDFERTFLEEHHEPSTTYVY